MKKLFALIYARGSGAYVTRKNFENMVRFGIYFDQIVSWKTNIFLYKKIIIIATRLL